MAANARGLWRNFMHFPDQRTAMICARHRSITESLESFRNLSQRSRDGIKIPHWKTYVHSLCETST